MMFLSKERIAMAELMRLAKEGDSEAISYLARHFSLKVYTPAEIAEVNRLRGEGLTLEQSIQTLKEQANNAS